MVTGAPWATTTGTMMDDGDLLTLAQWLSPAFPIGGFAYSHGLEQAIGAGDVGDGDALEQWVREVLTRGAGLSDGVLLAAAMGGDPGAAAQARARATSRERWLETRDQGDAFARTLNAQGVALPVGTALPVVVGLAARRLSVPVATVIALYLQTFAANLISVAVRFMPLGQSAGQRYLTALAPDILKVAQQAATLPMDGIFGAVPRADMAAMAHETMEVRLFRS